MTLRCRPGDWCVVVREARASDGDSGAVPRGVDFVALKRGTVVRVLQHVDGMWDFEHPVRYDVHVDGWQIGGWVTAACDEHLQPLRDEQGPDETIAWAGLPGQRDPGVSIVPLAPAYPAAAPSSLSGRDDFALGLRAGGSFFFG